MKPKLSDILDRESWELKFLFEITTDICAETENYPAIKSKNILI